MTALVRLVGTIALVIGLHAGTAAAADVIVFSAAPQGTETAQLFRVAPSGAGLKQLTTGASPADAPALSPGGRLLAFQRDGVGIFVVQVDGHGLRRLTTGGRDSYPVWSTDGKSIAFIRPTGPKWRVYVVPSTGGRARPLLQAPPAGRPSWVKDGLLIPSGGDLVRIDSANGRVRKYYNANIDAIWGQMSVALSPSASWLTYVGARAPEPGDKECGEGPCQRFGLFLENLLTKAKKPRMIVKDTGPAGFSPDGKRIVFAADGKLMVRSIASGATTAIPTGGAYPTNVAPPAWG